MKIYYFLILLLISCSEIVKTNNETSVDRLDNLKVDSFGLTPIKPRDFDQIIESGELRVLIQNTPTSYYIYKGSPIGFEYELSKIIADHFNLKLNIYLVNDTEEALNLLENGYADILAFDLTKTKDRKKRINFTESLYNVHQVLIQRKPDNWRNVPIHITEKQLVKTVIQLKNLKIHVEANSSYLERLIHLTDEIGNDIDIVEVDEICEHLIEQVASGHINYTVADNNIANIFQQVNPILDVHTPLSLDQEIAWGVNLNTTDWLLNLNKALKVYKNKPDIAMLYNKYYKNQKIIKYELNHFNDSLLNNQISQYDYLIKENSKLIDWDWRLLAALVYTESKFDNSTTSWVGAQGLMQLMPKTAEFYGVKNSFDPEQNIKGGVSYLSYLNKYWKEKLPDSINHQPFIIASYNAGQGHVYDALKLAKYYNEKDLSWGIVSNYLLKKNNSKYYSLPVVKHGYCRGSEPVNYVNRINYVYNRYQELINE